MADKEIQKSEAEFIIDIADDPLTNVPPNLVSGMDPDGLPRTDLGRETPPEVVVKKDPKQEKTKKDESDLVKALARERNAVETERQARIAAERQAQELRQQANNERKGRVEAETEATRFTGIATRAHLQSLQTRKEQYEQGLSNVKANMAQLKNQIRTASENADHAAVADLTEQMAKMATYERTYQEGAADYTGRLEDAQARIEAAAAARKEEETRRPAQETRPAEQQQEKPKTVDEWIDRVTPAVGDSTAKWMRDHKEMLTKRGAELRTFSDYYAARNGGHAAWKTAAFVEALNAEFYPEEGEVITEEIIEDEGEPEAKPQKAPHRPAAAPVTRSAPGKSSSQSSETRIQLSPQEFAIAPNQWKSSDWDLFDPAIKSKFKEWSPQAARFQYDLMKKKAIADGKYNRS